MKKRLGKSINNCIAGNSMFIFTPDGNGIEYTQDERKINLMDMMKCLRKFNLTYSGESLTFHPWGDYCYLVKNGEDKDLVVVHRGVFDMGEDVSLV